VGVLLGSDVGLPMWAAMLLCAVFQLIFWKMLKPFRRLTTMVSPNGLLTIPSAGPSLSGAKRFLGGAAGTALGVLAARKISGDDDDPKPAKDQPRPEGWSRPEPAAPLPLTAGTPPPQPGPAPTYRDVTGERTVQERVPYRDPLPAPALPPAPPPPFMPQTPRHATPRVDVRTSEDPDIRPAGEPLPPKTFRADPVMTDGVVVYRIWDPETGSYKIIEQEDTDADV
jgi:hypothetical protein